MTDWIMTFSGRMFYPTAPRVEDVAIEDIAHALSNLCRFAGHTRAFYSVAQHSALVADACRHDDAAVYGLLHDASEAYLLDVPRPLKRLDEFRDYRRCEAVLQAAIYRAFGLSIDDEPEDLKRIDRRMLRTEQRDLMPPAAPTECRDDVEPFQETIVPVPPPIAERLFLRLAARYGLRGTR